MVPHYLELLSLVKQRLQEIAYTVGDDSDYVASFVNGTPWRVVLAGERYHFNQPIFDLCVNLDQQGHHPKSFAVWLLMTIFSRRRNTEPDKPTLENQLDFLIKNATEIFVDPPPYQDEYDKLNAII